MCFFLAQPKLAAKAQETTAQVAACARHRCFRTEHDYLIGWQGGIPGAIVIISRKRTDELLQVLVLTYVSAQLWMVKITDLVCGFAACITVQTIVLLKMTSYKIITAQK